MEKHYRILGLCREAATEAEVKRAYRKKALLYHPDRNPTGGEDFKALQEAYEAALADVKQGSNHCSHSSRWGRDEGFSTNNTAAAPAAAGAGYHYARASASTQGYADHYKSSGSSGPSASPPFFSDEELFGDAVPGGWRDVGSQQRQTSHQEWKSHTPSSTPQRNSNCNTSSSSPADARWRRAHGSRVPVSAYNGACPVPPPSCNGAERTSFQSAPPGAAQKPTATSPVGKKETSTPQFSFPPSTKTNYMKGQQQRQQGQEGVSPTRAQWEAFLAQQHPWRPSSPAREADTVAEQSSSEDESADERAYLEALFLHRRVQELNKTDTRPRVFTASRSGVSGTSQSGSPTSSSPDTFRTANREAFVKRNSEVRKKELYRKWQDVQVSLDRKLDKQDHGNTEEVPHDVVDNTKDVFVKKEQTGEKVAAAATARGSPQTPTLSASSSPLPRTGFEALPRPRRDNAHREAMLKERRLLQREYLRYRYTPDPADVGEMSDMEVYLLSELLAEVQGKVQAVLLARLAKGPCSACSLQPRHETDLYFVCGHRSICANCYRAGALSCPLCGAARVTTAVAEDET